MSRSEVAQDWRLSRGVVRVGTWLYSFSFLVLTTLHNTHAVHASLLGL